MGTVCNETLLSFKSMSATGMLKTVSLNLLSGDLRKFVRCVLRKLQDFELEKDYAQAQFYKERLNLKSRIFSARINMKCHRKYI